MNIIFMNRQKDIPWEAIAAFLKQEADPQQKDAVENWLKASGENPALLREIASTWQLTRKKPHFYKPEEDLFWEKLVSRIGQKHRKEVPFRHYYKWIAAAAVLILVFLSGIWLGKQFLPYETDTVYSSIVVPPGSRTQTILPDGTKVWLNSGAELRYPTSFSANTREVYTSGECYFEVAKDTKHRFVVHCSGLSVHVFGTTFNVNEKATTHETIISLIEGNVKVVDSNEQLLASLLPGKQLVFSEGRGIVREARNLSALTSWINNSLVFEDQPLQEVATFLEGWYGVKIRLEPGLLESTHRYTFKVKTESLREVLDMISVITPVTYKIEGGDVIIGYK
jgi:ferric-dicitrate binding protein FerR (iron transport regulator)